MVWQDPWQMTGLSTITTAAATHGVAKSQADDWIELMENATFQQQCIIELSESNQTASWMNLMWCWIGS
jgi:hypothetical protein